MYNNIHRIPIIYYVLYYKTTKIGGLSFEKSKSFVLLFKNMCIILLCS